MSPPPKKTRIPFGPLKTLPEDTADIKLNTQPHMLGEGFAPLQVQLYTCWHDMKGRGAGVPGLAWA